MKTHNKNLKGWVTLEFVSLAPVFFLMFTTVILIGEISKKDLALQYHAYNTAKYIVESSKDATNYEEITNDNCKDYAKKLIQSDDFEVECSVNESILAIKLKQKLKFSDKNILLSGLEKELTAESYIYTR